MLSPFPYFSIAWQHAIILLSCVPHVHNKLRGKRKEKHEESGEGQFVYKWNSPHELKQSYREDV